MKLGTGTAGEGSYSGRLDKLDRMAVREVLNDFERACSTVHVFSELDIGEEVFEEYSGIDGVRRYLEDSFSNIDEEVSTALANRYLYEVIRGKDPYTALEDSLHSESFDEIYREVKNSSEGLSIGLEYEYSFREDLIVREDVEMEGMQWYSEEADFELAYCEAGPTTLELCTLPHSSIKGVAEELELRRKIFEDKLDSDTVNDRSSFMLSSFPGFHIHVGADELSDIEGKVASMYEETEHQMMVYSNSPGILTSEYYIMPLEETMSKRILFNKFQGMVEESYRYDKKHGTVEHVLPDLPSDRDQTEAFIATAVGLQYEESTGDSVESSEDSSKIYFMDGADHRELLTGKSMPGERSTERFLEKVGRGLENAGIPDAEEYVSKIRNQIERNRKVLESF